MGSTLYRPNLSDAEPTLHPLLPERARCPFHKGLCLSGRAKYPFHTVPVDLILMPEEGVVEGLDNQGLTFAVGFGCLKC